MKKIAVLLFVTILAVSLIPSFGTQSSKAQDGQIEITFSHVFGDENRQGLVQDVGGGCHHINGRDACHCQPELRDLR